MNTPIDSVSELHQPSPLPLPGIPADWQAALGHSRYLKQLLTTRSDLLAWLLDHWEAPLEAHILRDFLVAEGLHGETTLDDEGMKRALRRLRQRVMGQLILRDLSGRAPLAEVVETMTLLADETVRAAQQFIHADLARRHGEPRDHQGQPIHLAVVGMGKLGGRELNVSSDIDLIFVYPEEGETAGRADGNPGRNGSIENYEFFARLGKRLIAALNDLTEEGRVFRVDMRLRPNGDSGPLVCSLDALENYFITQGREWERYAWIKARVMNDGDVRCHADTLHGVARPFIFRKYLDFGAINAMRDLHAQIRQEVARKDMADHIKLGPGGIREIEFIAQVFQLIRGGRDRSLQIRPTLEVLARLQSAGILAGEAVQELRDAYDFLRRLEHRLQYVEDAQTHRLPEGAAEQAVIAQSMGYAQWAEFLPVLNTHRDRVARHFAAVFADPDSRESERGDEACQNLWLSAQGAGGCPDAACDCFTRLGYAKPEAAQAACATFRDSTRYQQLPESNRKRLDAVAPRLIEAAADTPQPDLTLQRGLNFLETISRRGAYLAFLQQYPQALHKVAALIGASSWAAEYLNHHPILLDEVLDPRLYEIATDFAALRTELARHLADAGGDVELEMNVLREIHHAQVFRLLAQDLAGQHSLEKISDFLSELADILVDVTLSQAWQHLRNRHRDRPAFAVIGYGKLGGKELGYASDLDIVFLYDNNADPDQSAEEIYSRLGQRMTTWLSTRTPSGILFETDLRLRPNGDAGLLVNSLAAYRDYLLHHAWVWEHQALTRARFVAGDPVLGRQFEALREEILRLPRELPALRQEVVAMRQRMQDAHGSTAEALAQGEFDLKQDPGGIIDVEFIVQYLILGHAHAHPSLTGNLGNIALLRQAAELGLIPGDLAAAVGNAYREFRRRQHAKRLNGDPKARVPRAELSQEIAAVTNLWQRVLGKP